MLAERVLVLGLAVLFVLFVYTYGILRVWRNMFIGRKPRICRDTFQLVANTGDAIIMRLPKYTERCRIRIGSRQNFQIKCGDTTYVGLPPDNQPKGTQWYVNDIDFGRESGEIIRVVIVTGGDKIFITTTVPVTYGVTNLDNWGKHPEMEHIWSAIGYTMSS